MSYPDLIEQDGRYWIAETQKTVARIHEIETTLLDKGFQLGGTPLTTPQELADFPFMRDTQWEILEKARDFYERILEQAAGDPEPRRVMVRICYRLGRLAWSSSRDGEPALRRGITILEELTQEFPDNVDDRIDRIWSHYWLASWLASDFTDSTRPGSKRPSGTCAKRSILSNVCRARIQRPSGYRTNSDGGLHGGPKHHTDFRRVYATLLENWLRFDSRAVLGDGFEPVDLFEA